MLQSVAAGLPGGEPAYLLVEHGRPAEHLADVAERESAQLLVAGARGRVERVEALLGSVASRLATTASQPLVIVPPHARPRPPGPVVMLATWRLRNSAILQVQGEIDYASAVDIEREAARLLCEADGRLVLDLSEATVEDAAEADVTERLVRRASELGGCVALVHTAPVTRRLLDLPHGFLLVTDNLDAAADAVARHSHAHPGLTGRR